MLFVNSACGAARCLLSSAFCSLYVKVSLYLADLSSIGVLSVLLLSAPFFFRHMHTGLWADYCNGS